MDILIILGILIIPAISQMYVMSNYNKFKAMDNSKGVTGFEVARKILDENGLDKIHVVEVKGNLTDHYDPKRKVVRLSKDVFHGNSISAASIAAHEVGHAIQDKEGYLYLKFRSIIFPMVRIGTQFSYIIIFIGILSEAVNLFYIGIALVSLGLLFQLITLPVEFNASSRAKKQLKKLDLVADNEMFGTDKVLSAAAMTYVAGVLASALEVLRLILVFNNKRR